VEVIVPCCAGLDVHKASIAVCVRRVTSGGKVQKVVQTFGTMTRDLTAMANWLAREGVTQVAMESTGVFWKPVFNLLEERFQILLCNAYHVKQVPGRKTDVKDCEWLAQLLQHGLLRGSFIPSRPLRELRDLTRTRAKLVDQKTAVANRIHKTLEDANVKLASVASDILGASGRLMLQRIIDGDYDPSTVANFAKQRLREKIPQLTAALEGRVTDHHRFMLKMLYGQLLSLEGLISQVDERVASYETPATPASDDAGPLFVSASGLAEQTEENGPLPFGTRCDS
jgi:transposase